MLIHVALHLAMMKIAKAYCTLVDKGFVGPVSLILSPLKMKPGIPLEGEATSVHPIAKMHAESSAAGWASFLKSAWRQKSRVYMNSSSR